MSRDRLLSELKELGITAQPGIEPIHLQSIYSSSVHESLPETERAAREIVMLPLYHSLNDDEQNYVIDSILEFVKE